MDLNKISNFIKEKRKDLGITQEELASKLFVTEKAISRWETGRGTPDISLLVPLAKELNVDVSEILNGEKNKKKQAQVEELIEYNEITKKNKFNIQFKLVIFFYVISILVFLFYLRFEYDPSIELNYFIRLSCMMISSLFIVIGNKIYGNNYVEKIEDKKKIMTFSQAIVFIYYAILLFNMVIFARYGSPYGYNLIPFKSIREVIRYGSFYAIIINTLGNLLVFVPLGYFIIELFRVKRFSLYFILSFSIIFLIESSQLVLKLGVFDIDDIILCLSSMVVFYFLHKTRY